MTGQREQDVAVGALKRLRKLAAANGCTWGAKPQQR